MMIRYIKLTVCLFISISSFSQQNDKWDLRRCVEYAMLNNISVKQADLDIRFARLNLDESKLAKYPSAQFGGNLMVSSGRNQDPTTFSLITTAYLANNYSLQTSVDVFNWFSKKNTVVARDLYVKAAEAGLDKAKNDIALNVAVAYLQVLLGREQTNLYRITLERGSVHHSCPA